MQMSSPAAAAAGPPLTPQSTMPTPAARASSPTERTHSGVMVLTTTNVVPGPAAARAPSRPDSTARTCSSFSTATTTTSAARARSAEVAATAA